MNQIRSSVSGSNTLSENPSKRTALKGKNQKSGHLISLGKKLKLGKIKGFFIKKDKNNLQKDQTRKFKIQNEKSLGQLKENLKDFKQDAKWVKDIFSQSGIVGKERKKGYALYAETLTRTDVDYLGPTGKNIYDTLIQNYEKLLPQDKKNEKIRAFENRYQSLKEVQKLSRQAGLMVRKASTKEEKSLHIEEFAQRVLKAEKAEEDIVRYIMQEVKWIKKAANDHLKSLKK